MKANTKAKARARIPDANVSEFFYAKEVQRVVARWRSQVAEEDIVTAVNLLGDCAELAQLSLEQRGRASRLGVMGHSAAAMLSVYIGHPRMAAQLLNAIESYRARRRKKRDLIIEVSQLLNTDYHTANKLPVGNLTHKEIGDLVESMLKQPTSAKYAENEIKKEISRRRKIDAASEAHRNLSKRVRFRSATG